jgi:hypothetical protein
MKEPTQAQLQQLRALLDGAGGAAELRRWIAMATALKKQPKGRPRDDKWVEADYWIAHEATQRLILGRNYRSVSEALREVVKEKWRAGEPLGASEDAVFYRVFARLRPFEIKGQTKGKRWKATFAKPEFDFELLTRLIQPRCPAQRRDLAKIT